MGFYLVASPPSAPSLYALYDTNILAQLCQWMLMLGLCEHSAISKMHCFCKSWQQSLLSVLITILTTLKEGYPGNVAHW